MHRHLCKETGTMKNQGNMTPVSRDEGRQWWQPELVAYIQLAVEASFRCLCSGGGWLQTYMQWWGPGQAATARINYGCTESHGASMYYCGCWILPSGYSSRSQCPESAMACKYTGGDQLQMSPVIQARERKEGQIQAHKQLQGPQLSPCHSVATQSPQRCVHSSGGW